MSDYMKEVENRAEEQKSFVEKHLEKDIWKLQKFLHLKSAWTYVLEKLDPKIFYYVRKDEQFGFSEMMVNQLIVLAYNLGRTEGLEPARRKGYDDAIKDVATKLGLSYDDRE